MAPADGAVLTNYPRTAELQWTPITSASKYEIGLYVVCDGCVSPWVNVDNLTSDNVYVVTSVLAADKFRAKVRAVYPDNTYSQWSDYVHFSYKTASTLTTPPTADTVVIQPVATEPTTETAVQPTQQTSGEAITEPEEAQPAVESKPTVAPKVAEKKVGRMFCGNSAGEDGLYSACVKDTIKLDNKINITVRTYNSRYVWLAVKNGKKAYYRVPFDGSVEIISKNGKSKIDVTYVKKSPKFGVFLQIDTTL